MGTDPLSHYSETAIRSAAVVIKSYSTSFGLACLLLGAKDRRDIENIYALVRVADEVVDGAAAAAGLGPEAVCAQLDALEKETEQALHSGYSTNMVVHAFAGTARRAGIDTALTKPFFASMRTDLSRTTHSPSTLAEYIYGSAEVVGLMCLKVFRAMEGAPAGHDQQLVDSARSLGAAFQKVNFLRDLGADSAELGRLYFPGLDPAAFNDQHKDALLAEIRQDLAVARAGMPFLAPPARRAVHLAHDLFAALVAKMARIPAAKLARQRVRIAGWHKAVIAAKVCLSRNGRSVREHAVSEHAPRDPAVSEHALEQPSPQIPAWPGPGSGGTENMVPEATAPESKVPQAKVPQAKVPQAKVSEPSVEVSS